MIPLSCRSIWPDGTFKCTCKVIINEDLLRSPEDSIGKVMLLIILLESDAMSGKSSKVFSESLVQWKVFRLD